MNEIKISVIIPCYNQEDLVVKAIDSIPKRNDIEIIVIDDGSLDCSFDKILKYRNEHPEMLNLILLYNEENKGVAYTVNRGYDVAKGEYIVLLGSDDYFYTNAFNQIIEELDGTDLVYFDIKVNNGDVWNVNNDSKYALCGSVKFMRRDFIADTRCPENKKWGEDVNFYNELIAKKPTEKFTHIIVKHYNYPRANSLTDLARKGLLSDE